MRPKMAPADYVGFGVCAFLGGASLCGFVLFLGAHMPSCGSGNEHCVREWLGATSGWIAAIITFASLYYLAKQVKSLSTPFIQMRMNDYREELREIDQIFGQIDMFKPKGNFEKLRFLAKTIGTTECTVENLDKFREILYDISSDYSAAGRKIITLNAFYDDEIIKDCYNQANIQIADICSSALDMADEIFIQHSSGETHYPRHFLHMSVMKFQSDMMTAQKTLLRLTLEISHVIAKKRADIDARITQ